MRPIPVFVGPSLRPEDRGIAGFEWRPPAQAGDLVSMLDDPPPKLCLIDGLFDRCAAPWHKEILLLMAAGTTVFGAASMGALRAAELERHGMIGIGSIFRAYSCGLLTGDDEVALVHATERLNWAPLSVPMVEIRATLALACRRRVLAPALARRVRSAVHEIHFEDRDWAAIAALCSANGLLDRKGASRLQSLHVPLKRLDALSCLQAAPTHVTALGRPANPPKTCFIRKLASECGVEAALDRELPQVL